jgi:NAD+ synthase (glutamine-hydrolysing)
MNIILAQINSTVGAIEANTQLILDTLQANTNTDLIVFPELALTGYPPEDLLLRPHLYTRCEQALEKIAQATQKNHTAIILGHPTQLGSKRYNSASCYHQGKRIALYHKRELPNYTVFDEKRYFTPGTQSCVFELKDIQIGLIICEDTWLPEPTQATQAAGAELIISINASPFALNKDQIRESVVKQRTQETLCPLLYVNCVGGQDELVFDGGSLAVNANSAVIARAPQFKTDCLALQFDTSRKQFYTAQTIPKTESSLAQVYNALVLGVRDYIQKNKFPGAIIGLSGGIDSALTLAIATDAIGGENVSAISMPSRYTAGISNDDAKQQAKQSGVHYNLISIEPMFDAFLTALKPSFSDKQPDTTEQNIQARIRGVLLMALSNQTGKLVLTTGNKSEMAVGYTTIYGDMAGGFAVLKDIPKTMVYALANYRNTVGSIIPERVITRPPSAELAPDQKDQDTLPDYDTLDSIINLYIDQDQDAEYIIQQGFEPTAVEKIIHLIKRNEYKRRQAPPGIRISERAFGKDRRYPITSGY